tara:strand:- start:2324 stop:2479 length:156 start_codon:yes stop_codon:yes gene_type:complete
MNEEEIKVGIYSYKDEATGETFYDFDEMVEEFESKLKSLDPTIELIYRHNE